VNLIYIVRVETLYLQAKTIQKRVWSGTEFQLCSQDQQCPALMSAIAPPHKPLFSYEMP
jgi:hypothetical protein